MRSRLGSCKAKLGRKRSFGCETSCAAFPRGTDWRPAGCQRIKILRNITANEILIGLNNSVRAYLLQAFFRPVRNIFGLSRAATVRERGRARSGKWEDAPLRSRFGKR